MPSSPPALPAGPAVPAAASASRQGGRRRTAARTDSAPPDGNRVLIVEDDPAQAGQWRHTLEAAGHQVKVCDDPWRFAGELAAWRPNLVLMDVILPGASGYELVRALRQVAGASSLPVLFLTTEGRAQACAGAARVPADDHLVKPLVPAALLAAVGERLERSCRARQHAMRDPIARSLTGTELLRHAAAACERLRLDPHRQTVWAALELDHLWSIHECYGEITGNRVLAAMAAALRRRLRPADCLGRIDGARLAVLLEDLDPGQAQETIDGVRREFAESRHTTPANSTFRTTFSAGVAALVPDMSVEEWREAAERALRVARAAGRNRVERIR